MIKKILLFIPLALSVGVFQAQALTLPIPRVNVSQFESAQYEIVARREMSLLKRYPDKAINVVFANNILLNLSYMSNRVDDPAAINWEEVRKPQQHTIVLKPGEVFAYHDEVKSEFSSMTVTTTNAHFNAQQGFLSSGYLFGDGVCHLASLFHWAAKDAGLKVVAPVNHNFAVIPDVPAEFGTSIYYSPDAPANSQSQNLYIQNTLDKTITFVIYSQADNVSVVVKKEK